MISYFAYDFYDSNPLISYPVDVYILLIQMLSQNKKGIEDLNQLLKVDPTNTAAKREMEVMKKLWREVCISVLSCENLCLCVKWYTFRGSNSAIFIFASLSE